MPERHRVLFLCTANACRSQMAEGWTRVLKGDQIDAYSAGVAPREIDPRAVRVMAQAGVDISGQVSKHVDELRDVPFDCVVTLCDHAVESCPVFGGAATRVHHGFPDPPRLATAAASEAEILSCYRQVRDAIRAFIETLPADRIRR